MFLQGKASFLWPDDAITAVAALEKASHETLSSDFQKYNQKMRQLQFNLKVDGCLTFLLLACMHTYMLNSTTLDYLYKDIFVIFIHYRHPLMFFTVVLSSSHFLL